MRLTFEWDPAKAVANLRKHGISFDEASTVFEGDLAAIFLDIEHSAGEVREIIVGYSVLKRLLVVSFTERRIDRVRIISGRQATKRETRDYEQRSSGEGKP